MKRDSQLVVSGGEVTFEPADPSATRMPALLVEYDSTPGGPLVGLRVLAGTVHLKGIRLELDRHNAQIVMSGVEVQGGQVVLERCQLLARNCSGPTRISTLSMSSRSGVDSEPALVLKQCYFEGGQQAVYVSGPALVQATACALGPHSQTFFHLARENVDDVDRRRSVEIKDCSAFLKEGSAFRIDQGVDAGVRVENCVFSRPEVVAIGPALGALVEKGGSEPEGSFRYSGAGNYYHNLAAFWVRPMAMGDPDVIAHLDGFRQRFGIKDEDSVERDLDGGPWREKQPLQLLEDGVPSKAFARHSPSRPMFQSFARSSRIRG
ncbi:MAG: hypothetical protein E6K70_26605 [Planctomycetota bacterium]|nr:MAG: hypothetical protein E6K70_26605 [Planctomycetota bacterium]